MKMASDKVAGSTPGPATQRVKAIPQVGASYGEQLSRRQEYTII